MSKKEKKLKCIECKKEFIFFIHICKRYISESFGCPSCDDYCCACKKEESKNK